MMKKSLYLHLFLTLISTSVFFPLGRSQADDTMGRPGDTFVLHGELGDAEKLSIERYDSEPFTNISWMRADISLEQKRIFTNYSGDISGRFLEVMAALYKEDTGRHRTIEPIIEAAIKLQCADGHYGDPTIDWDGPVDMHVSYQVGKFLPTLWGNGRILCGLIDMYKATGDRRLLECAEKLGDFYADLCKRLTNPKRISEFTGFSEKEINDHLARCEGKQLTLLPATGETHAGGYVTCFFPGMEGLTKLYLVTKNKKYLKTAERMAEFYRLFDVPDTTHVHGMLCCHYTFLLLYLETGDKDYLDRVERRWETITSNGVVCALGGMSEAARLHFSRDEGCALADWLRVNVKLFEITGNPRYLEIAERLMHNQYLTNEWSNGGFGHRHILCDKGGIYGLGPHWMECVWCCNYHGTMGFLNFKKYLASFDSDTLSVQFAVDFEASLTDGDRKAGLSSQVRFDPPRAKADRKASLPDGVVLSQTLEFRAGNVDTAFLRVRIPDWADGVTIKTGDGKAVETKQEGKYLKTKEKISFDKRFSIDYEGGVVIENRTLTRIDPKADEKGRFGQVVFRYGPKTLVARNIRNIPMIKVPKNGNAFPELSRDGLAFECSVPVKVNIRKLDLTPFGYGTEKETAVFVFEATAGDLEHYTVDLLVSRKAGAPIRIAAEDPDANGTPGVLATDPKTEAAYWRIDEIGDGYCRIMNCLSGKLLSESGDGQERDGRKVHQWDDVTSDAQLWKKEALADGFVRFINKKSGRALNLDAEGKTNVRCVEDDPSQQWSIRKTDGR